MVKYVDKNGYEVDLNRFENWCGDKVHANDITGVDVSGRKAECIMCGCEWRSDDKNLDCFKYNEDLDHDDYWCGCRW